MKNMLEERKGRMKTILGVGICLVSTLLFKFSYILVNYHTKVIDITSIPIIETNENRVLYIEEVSTDKDGVLYVTAATKNTDINYNYYNWVLGGGNNVYKKASILLVDKEEKNAYKLKTYPYAFNSKDDSVSDELCTGDGVLAYGNVKMLKEDSRKVAVLFEDREGNSYVLYPKEEYYIDEK